MAARFTFQGTTDLQALLDQVAQRLLSQGHRTGAVSIHGQEYPFELRAEQFSGEDHGAGAPTCAVCDTVRERRFALYVRCLDGEERGPIGSACLFTQVLGETAGRRYGQRLQALAQDAAHRADHQARLDAAGNHYRYLEDLGLAWIHDAAELQRVSLNRSQRLDVVRARETTSIVPQRVFAVLSAHRPLQKQAPLSPNRVAVPASLPDGPPTSWSAGDQRRYREAWPHGMSAAFTSPEAEQVWAAITSKQPRSAALAARLAALDRTRSPLLLATHWYASCP